MKTLYLLRHGETAWNKEGRTQGQKDTQLTAQGVQQAEQAAQYLSTKKIEAVYCSHLRRAVDTGTVISQKLNLPIYYSDQLAEVGFGEWEGLTYPEIKAQYPIQLDLWHRSPHQVEIPQWEGIHQAQKRMSIFVNQLIESTPCNNIAIVSHGTIIKLYLMDFLGMNLSEFYKLRLDNCCLNVIDFLERGPVLSRYNDTSYMETIIGAEDNGI